MQAIMPNRSLQWEENCFHFLMHLTLTFAPVGKARPLGGPIVSQVFGQWIDPEAVFRETSLLVTHRGGWRRGTCFTPLIRFSTVSFWLLLWAPWKAYFNHHGVFLPRHSASRQLTLNKLPTYTAPWELISFRKGPVLRRWWWLAQLLGEGKLQVVTQLIEKQTNKNTKMAILVPPRLESKACVFPTTLGWLLTWATQEFPSLVSPHVLSHDSLLLWSRNPNGASGQPFTFRPIWLCPVFAYCLLSCLHSPSTLPPLPLVLYLFLLPPSLRYSILTTGVTWGFNTLALYHTI